MSYRAGKSGFAAENQSKIEANYSEDEAAKCLRWIQLMTGVEDIPNKLEGIDASAESFQAILGDGTVLLKLLDSVYPGHVNWKDKMFQTARIEAMQSMRERERIATFTNKVKEFGVIDTYIFPTESLHDLGSLNLCQVCNCLRALGIEAQTKSTYTGPEGFWPKKNEKNVREFSEEQLRASQGYVSLQYGSNKGASQAGLNMGKPRHIV